MEEAYLDLLTVHDGHKLDENRNLEENVILDSCGMTAKDLRFLHCYRWVRLVSWVDGFNPFSAPGNSGALVYCMPWNDRLSFLWVFISADPPYVPKHASSLVWSRSLSRFGCKVHAIQSLITARA
jgi:hypothetical protein